MFLCRDLLALAPLTHSCPNRALLPLIHGQKWYYFIFFLALIQSYLLALSPYQSVFLQFAWCCFNSAPLKKKKKSMVHGALHNYQATIYNCGQQHVWLLKRIALELQQLIPK